MRVNLKYTAGIHYTINKWLVLQFYGVQRAQIGIKTQCLPFFYH